MYALKERSQLESAKQVLQENLDKMDDWFDGYTRTFSNSVWSNAKYDSTIRKPYNEMFDLYERVLELVRVSKYYLEKLC